MHSSFVLKIVVQSARQFLIPPHQFGDAACLGGSLDGDAIGFHNGPVVLLMGLAQFRWHGHFVVQIGKAAIWVQVASV